MEDIKNLIPIGAEIYKFKTNDDGYLEVHFKDHFSDAYNSSFKKYRVIEKHYDTDLLEPLIGYTRPTQDYLERVDKLKKLANEIKDLDSAKNYLDLYKLTDRKDLDKNLIYKGINAQEIVLDKGTSKDKFKYILYDYFKNEIKSYRDFIFGREIKLLSDDITLDNLLFEIKLFNNKVEVYNTLCTENGFMKFPKYWIKNPVVKSIVGDKYES